MNTKSIFIPLVLLIVVIVVMVSVFAGAAIERDSWTSGEHPRDWYEKALRQRDWLDAKPK